MYGTAGAPEGVAVLLAGAESASYVTSRNWLPPTPLLVSIKEDPPYRSLSNSQSA